MLPLNENVSGNVFFFFQSEYYNVLRLLPN